ncbi:cupin domain-containing protein [Rhodococcus sp. NPDC058521]|uniref:cupin domain-containing protein n=1 Tax=Rhodococcus sp. NPDC058521 TaxID=3346536 RepID=UPI00365AED96
MFDASDTDGAVSSLEVRLAKDADGALPHFHTLSSELFYVVAGELRVMAGDRIETVTEGGSLMVPKLMPHAFGATPDSDVRLLIVLTPGVERFGYFRLLARIQSGEARPEELAAAQDEYDNHFVDAPQWWRDREDLRAGR